MTANVPALIQAVEARAPAFAKVLPRTIKVDRFLAAAKTALLTVPGIDACDTQSVVVSCMRAAADGLVPDGRDAVFVVGRTRQGPQAQYWVMVGGLMKIAFRSGYVLKLESRVVHAADSFALSYGTQPGIEHRPTLRDRGEVTGAYAIATLRSGHTYVEYMDADEINGIMRRSKSFDRERGEPRGPWATDYSEMARKTVLRRALKYLPTEAAASRDEDIEVPLPAAPEAELTQGAIQSVTEGGVTYTTLERTADRPVEEPEGQAEAEMLEEAAEAGAEDASRRKGSHPGMTNPESEVTLWKRRLRELRDRLAMCANADETERTWTEWDGDHHPPAEVTARAKELVDERLGALSYKAAKAS